jgi:hypothetical protein
VWKIDVAQVPEDKLSDPRFLESRRLLLLDLSDQQRMSAEDQFARPWILYKKYPMKQTPPK